MAPIGPLSHHTPPADWRPREQALLAAARAGRCARVISNEPFDFCRLGKGHVGDCRADADGESCAASTTHTSPDLVLAEGRCILADDVLHNIPDATRVRMTRVIVYEGSAAWLRATLGRSLPDGVHGSDGAVLHVVSGPVEIVKEPTS